MKHANAQEIAERSRLRTRDEGRDMDWEDYHDLDTIYAWLDELEGKEGMWRWDIESYKVVLRAKQHNVLTPRALRDFSSSTRSIVYKGWLIRDEILRLVEFKEIFRDCD